MKNSTNGIVNIDDLNNKKVGMIKNWNSTNILKKEHPSINIIEFDSIKDIFDAIQNNFIDATIQNKILANYYIKKHYYGNLNANVEVDIKGFKTNLYMGIQKDSTYFT